MSEKPENALRSNPDSRTTPESKGSSPDVAKPAKSARPTVLFLDDIELHDGTNDELALRLEESYEVLHASGDSQIADQLRREGVAGVFLPASQRDTLLES